jgi:uncharacterized membrane protein
MLRKPWLYLACIVALTLLVTPFAGAFSVPTGPSSHVQLPGVLMFIALAVLCCVAFLRCPRRPLWAKIVALVLTVPSLLFAVYSVTHFLAFGME